MAAADTYLALVAQTDTAGYRDAVAQAGLTDMLQPGAAQDVLEAVEQYFYREICGLSFPDLTGHWSARYALTCASSGLFSGDEAGQLPPGQRCDLGGAAHRALAGGRRPQLSGPWDGAWYAGGANFALSAGLVREDALLPQQDMTREDVALVLYRFALTLGAETLTDTGALMAYPGRRRALRGGGCRRGLGPGEGHPGRTARRGGWTPRGPSPGGAVRHAGQLCLRLMKKEDAVG